MCPCYYIANGYSLEPQGQDHRYGLCEMRIFNPTHLPAHVTMTIYYPDRPPAMIPEQLIAPEQSGFDEYLPFRYPDVIHHQKTGFWGALIHCDVPVLVDFWLSAGLRCPNACPEWPLDPSWRYCSSSPAHTRLAKLWYLCDGGEILRNTPDSDPFPFHELEWYHILNPGPEPCHATFHCFYNGQPSAAYSYEVEAERVRVIDTAGLHPHKGTFGIKVTSDRPIAIQGERFVYSIHGIEDWGMHLHMQRIFVPAPLPWDQEPQ
ncbi:MAG: hypothetical protein ACUVX9_10225 [Anaerolineae bacterium]